METSKQAKLRRALFKLGYIIPETADEIKEFEKIIKKKNITHFPEITNPIDIVKSDLKLNLKKTIDENGNQEFSNLISRAAREGKNRISIQTLSKMKQDRLDAEEKN